MNDMNLNAGLCWEVLYKDQFFFLVFCMNDMNLNAGLCWEYATCKGDNTYYS
jgi:hypothetical protein